MSDLQIRKLEPTDAPDLSRLLTADAPEYRGYFVPFDSSAESIAKILASAQEDRYWGIYVGLELASLVMLRGLDEGYKAPSFGVYVAKGYAGKGLSKLALHYALAWCHVNHCEEIMLSVHADNAYACRVYEQAGFEFTGRLSKIGHRVYRKRLVR